jgi:glycosyltransferase involved in cell wall biosynthesis
MILLTTNQIHALCHQGTFYNASDAIINYAYLARTLAYYDKVHVLVRCRTVTEIDKGLLRLDGPGVTIVPLPDPVSPLRALGRLPSLIRQIYSASKVAHVCYLKLPDAVGTLVGMVLWACRRPYAVEVVADSFQGIIHAKKSMPLVGLYARLFDGLTKFLVSRAASVTYISQYLRHCYPHPQQDRQWIFCSVELTEEFRSPPRDKRFFQQDPFKIVSAGRLSAEKGHLYLIRAFKTIVEQAGRPVELHILGDGPERERLEAEVRALGLTDQVQFHGALARGPVLFETLDRMQLYILPSLTEGMGRGLIEAIGRGLPCLASAVGGVPEYLNESCLFPPADPDAIAHKVLDLLSDTDTLARLSQQNYDAGAAFTPEQLKTARDAFWSSVGDTCIVSAGS